MNAEAAPITPTIVVYAALLHLAEVAQAFVIENPEYRALAEAVEQWKAVEG